MTLTTSWQNVASYTFEPGTGFKAVFYLDAKYSTQSKENNTTTVQTRLNCDVQSGSGGGNGYRFTLSYANTREGSSYWGFEDETIMTGESTITHNADGTKSINLSASMRVNYTGLDASMSVNVDLPRIDRYPLITSAPDFNDEENPTIQYTTILGFQGATVQAGISSLDNNTMYVPYRNIVVADGSYTFNLTNEERNTLRNATPNSNYLDVKFVIKTTTTNNVNYYSRLQKKLTIINDSPTFTFTEEEINPKVVALLGSSGSTTIQNASTLQVVVSPTALKGSSITGVAITSKGAYTKTTPPYLFDLPIKINNYAIRVYDSRNNETKQTITKTMIEYQPVDITNLSMKRVNPTSSNIVLNLETRYFQKTFGSTANVPVVKWKLDDGSWTTIPSTEYTIDTTNNKLTITNYQLTNVLDYRSSGQFYLSIEDLLTTDQESGTNGYVLKGIPTFDAGEHDFKVNGELYVADTDGQNKKIVMKQIPLTTDGNAVKTGRIIDGYDEYVKRITLDDLPDTNTSKTWQTGIDMTNIVITDVKIMAKAGTGNWFPLPNNNVVNCETALLNDGNIRITMFVGNLYNRDGSAEIYYYHTS